MKKIIFTILSFMLYLNVSAAAGVDCTQEQVTAGYDAIKDVTYVLQYNADETTIDGIKQNGYYYINFPNLPDGYAVDVVNNSQFATRLLYSDDVLSLYGGVYRIELYSRYCDTLLKSYEIRIPFYKKDCKLEEEECEQKDVWSDGTVSLSGNTSQTNEKSVSWILVASILGILLIILVLFLLKRRYKHEKDM